MKTRKKTVFLLLIDAFAYVFTFWIVYEMRKRGDWGGLFSSAYVLPLTPEKVSVIVITFPFYLFCLYIFGFYEFVWKQYLLKLLINLIFVELILLFFFLICFYSFQIEGIPRSFLFTFLFLNFILLSSYRSILNSSLFFRNTRRAVVIGLNEPCKLFLKTLRRSRNVDLKILGAIAIKNSSIKKFYIHPVLGALNELEAILKKIKPDYVFIFPESETTGSSIFSKISCIETLNVRFFLYPEEYELHLSYNGTSIADFFFIQLFSKISRQFLFKRIFDVGVSALLLVFIAPLILTIYVLIRITSQGSGIYSQIRIGKDGKEFQIYKFRTMVNDAERKTGAVLSKKNDDRITSIGRLLRSSRLDELPQLWNILKGDMSFIGPRPERPVFVKRFKKHIPGYVKRHKVRPGITGLAQVKGHYLTEASQKLRFDLWYIYHFNWALECSILAMTLKTMILKRGS